MKHDIFKELDGWLIFGWIKEYSIDYKIYEVVKTIEEEPVYLLPSKNYEELDVNNVFEITPYLSGGVKWDGCSNWYFDEQDDCMLHFCGPEDFKSLNDVFNECWTLTKDNLSTWY